jgi:hypothetical protein
LYKWVLDHSQDSQMRISLTSTLREECPNFMDVPTIHIIHKVKSRPFWYKKGSAFNEWALSAGYALFSTALNLLLNLRMAVDLRNKATPQGRGKHHNKPIRDLHP